MPAAGRIRELHVDALQVERDIAKRDRAEEVRSRRIELAEANEVISELRKAIAAGNRGSGNAEVIDLVPVSRRN